MSDINSEASNIQQHYQKKNVIFETIKGVTLGAVSMGGAVAAFAGILKLAGKNVGTIRSSLSDSGQEIAISAVVGGAVSYFNTLRRNDKVDTIKYIERLKHEKENISPVAGQVL